MLVRLMLTGAIVVVAIAVIIYKYLDYFANPWTRDGMVRAQVVQITPRVSGPIFKLSVEDNQFVKAGDVLFKIDPRTFAAALEQARANLDRTRDEIAALEKQVDASRAAIQQGQAVIRQAKSTTKGREARLVDARSTLARSLNLVEKGAVSQQKVDDDRAHVQVAEAQLLAAEADLTRSEAELLQAEADLARSLAELGAEGEENARLRAAKAAVESARLDLEFTEVRAPVDGYVTNLNLRLGSQGVANHPALALVDVNSYWVHGFFRETLIGDIRKGDRAIVTLMSYPDTPLEGVVDSKGKGIAQEDGSTGFGLLPQISPTFEWIRLAQRVPVRVRLVDVPDHIELVVGTTASVLVMTGTAGSEGGAAVPPAPKTLQ